MIYGYHITRRKEDVSYLHLDIDNTRGTPKEIKILKQYSNVKFGDIILRYIIIPVDVKLIALYYTLQRLIGCINRCLYFSKLPLIYEEIGKAKEKVRKSYKSYCIYKDGLNDMDNITNLLEFCSFLSIIFEDDKIEKREEILKFIRGKDWYIYEVGDPGEF